MCSKGAFFQALPTRKTEFNDQRCWKLKITKADAPDQTTQLHISEHVAALFLATSYIKNQCKRANICIERLMPIVSKPIDVTAENLEKISTILFP